MQNATHQKVQVRNEIIQTSCYTNQTQDHCNDDHIYDGDNFPTSITPDTLNKNIHSNIQNQVQNMLVNIFMNAPTKGFCQAFSSGFVLQTSLSLIPAIFSRKISLNRIKKIYSSKSSLLFATICGLISFTFKAILCVFKRFGFKHQFWHRTFAGFICGIWILFDNKHRRNKLALYCIIRSLADLIRICIHYKKIPNIKHGNVITFIASQMIIMYATFKDPNNLDNTYYKWIMYMCGMREDAVQKTMRSPSGAMYRLSNDAFVKCYPVYHNNPSCLMTNIKNWFATLVRAAKMYLPVHFVHTILLKPKSVFRDGWLYGPISFAKIKLVNTLMSSIFLATYVFNVRYTICLMRNIIRDDPAYVPICGGFMSGLSLLIEHPKRRSELMLYCVPKAMEFFINRMIRRQEYTILCKLLQTKMFPTIVFQISLAIWLTIYNMPKGIENCNFINMKAVQIVFGNKPDLSLLWSIRMSMINSI
eukprot:421181_1